MKRLFLQIMLTGLLIFPAIAQQNYFQQEVNTKINCTLDDVNHILTGNIEIEYLNNSPDALGEIYLHLWANAYKDRNTAFAKQKLRTNSTKFYFAKPEKLGNFSALNFSVSEGTSSWDYDAENPDIAILKLGTPIQPGDKIYIKSPFTLKIPASYSRLGHVAESYQMTQWFPKPAVYDSKGWHPMPYLDMGEFYSEFGSYDVSINLPENYVVAATGVLQTESEKMFLQQKVHESDELLKKTIPQDYSFPASSTKMKTIRYFAQDVHDFAWFADKRFYVQKNKVSLASGKEVDTWAFFTNQEGELWKKGNSYVDRSVKFYSEKVGEYPYPHATAVQSALSAGGGMEYPMITVIGAMGDAQALDEVITHEVGHNWFYGILAFNERNHAWMDEGINSYYDHRYTKEFYPDNIGQQYLPKFLAGDTDMSIMEIGYLYIARKNVDQAPAIHSDQFNTEINYGIGAYEKPAEFFRYLQFYLGTKKFDAIMQSFYEKWKFKHPSPKDLRSHFGKESGKNLDWFFDDFIGSNKKLNYGIQKLEQGENYKITVKNKGDIPGPVTLSGIKDMTVVNTKWYDGFEGKKTLDFPKGDYDEIVIDPQRYSLDVDRKNNHIKPSGLLKRMEPLKFKFLSGIEDDKRTTLYWTPALGWNHYDKIMIGAAFYNSTLLTQPFQFMVVPMFAPVSKSLVGTGVVKYNFFPQQKAFRQITIGLGFRRFNQSYNDTFDYRLDYNRIMPYLDFVFAKKNKSTLEHHLELRMINLFEAKAVLLEDGGYDGKSYENPLIFQLNYEGENRRALHPFNYRVGLEQQTYNWFGEQQNYLKLTTEFTANFTYKSKKNITARLYGGFFLQNSVWDRSGMNVPRSGLSLYTYGNNDYQYEDYYFGRTEQDDLWSKQIALEQGAMKIPLNSPSNSIGKSNHYILALNLKADLPMKLPSWLPIKPYFDVGYFKGDTDSINKAVLYSGGLALEYFNGAFGVYFPFLNSSTIRSADNSNSFGKRITFTLDLNRMQPWAVVNRMF